MKKQVHFSLIAILLMQMVAFIGGEAAAGPVRALPATPVADHQVDQILPRIETRLNAFRQSFDLAVGRSRREDTQQVRVAQEHFRALNAALQNFRQRYNERRETASDVAEVMNHARSLDQFFAGRLYLDTRSRQDWTTLRSELNQLALQYNLRDDVASQPGTSLPAIPAADRQVDPQLLTRIQTRRNAFRQSFDLAVNRSRRQDAQQVRVAQEHFRALDAALQNYRQRYNEGRATSSDVAEVMNHARSLDQFFSGGLYLDTRSRQDWTTLYSELNELSQQYNRRDQVGLDNTGRINDRGNWNDRTRGVRTDPNSMRLTGTYRLDATRSEDSMQVADRITRGLSAQQQQRIRNMITRRLAAPEMLAINREGRNITVASTNAPPVTFEADGRPRTEQTPRGRNVTVTTSVVGDQLIVSQTGDRGNDFRVTFDPMGDGRRLTVTRQMDIENLGQPVVVTSTYDKTSEVAQMDIYTGGPAVVGSTDPTAPSGSYIMPDGTQIVATLNENLMAQQTKAGDRFTLTVQSPPEYAGATIEGYIVDADRSGRLAGRSEIALNFDRIRMRNGSSHTFQGIIESVRTPRGDNVRVNTEGTVSDSSQTKRTVTRAGIGAALGAIIGAIAGGGTGAAVGAAVGAGAGAGSIILEGRDNLELTNGTQFTLRASAPRDNAVNRDR